MKIIDKDKDKALIKNTQKEYLGSLKCSSANKITNLGSIRPISCTKLDTMMTMSGI